jgi:hypothetical protein
MVDALIDTGSDVTLFPEAVAAALHLDLSSRPLKPLSSALGVVAMYREAEVWLELRRPPDQTHRWRAVVGFLPRRMAFSILGTKGFFESLVLRYDATGRSVDLWTDGLPPA